MELDFPDVTSMNSKQDKKNNASELL